MSIHCFTAIVVIIELPKHKISLKKFYYGGNINIMKAMSIIREIYCQQTMVPHTADSQVFRNYLASQ